jgi:hypothetical protein
MKYLPLIFALVLPLAAGTFTAVWSYGDMTGVDHFNLYVGTNAPVACLTTNAPVSGPWRTPVYVTAVDTNGVESAPQQHQHHSTPAAKLAETQVTYGR